jgi:uncharacterized membrane protein
MGTSIKKQKKINYMKTRKKILNAIVLLFALSPIAYLLLVWTSVPETIITRFNFDEPVVKEQGRRTLLIVTIILSITAACVYLLMRNLNKIDPKVKNDTPASGFNRMGLSVTFFLVLLNYFFILSALHSWEISKKVIFIFLGLLLAVLGNYMNNLKPNFFAGIRLPWTLKDENNWRQTHHLAGKLWFLGGIVLALISWFLHETALKPIFITIVVLMVLIPGIYSYLLFRNKK